MAMILNFFHLSHLPSGFLFIVGTSLTFGNMKELAPPSSYPSHHDSPNLPSSRSMNVELMHCSLGSLMFLIYDEWIFFSLHTGFSFFLPVQGSNNPEPKNCPIAFCFFFKSNFNSDITANRKNTLSYVCDTLASFASGNKDES